jgi:heme exporter protein D
MQTIGTRHKPETVAAVEADRLRLGMSLTEWMAMAVGMTLGAKVKVADTVPYRKPPTREELRTRRREERLAAARKAAGIE